MNKSLTIYRSYLNKFVLFMFPLKMVSYLILMPVLIFGTATGVIQQNQTTLVTEIFIISSLLFVIDISLKDNNKVNLLSFGFIMLGFGMFSRLLSIWLPGANAMAAFVMLTGIYGGESLGFSVGSMAPLLTNMVFLQGAWTPFQMYAYGMLGAIAGIPFIAKYCKINRWVLTIFSVVMGIAYSLFMDTWTLLSIETIFGWQGYWLLIMQAIPYTLKYMITNGVFINFLKKPVANLIKIIGKV